MLAANSVQVNNFQKSFRLLSNELMQEIQDFWQQHQYSELEGRSQIMESFCPQVYGLYAVKLAVSVVLCGGLERIDQTGTKIRGEPHMVRIFSDVTLVFTTIPFIFNSRNHLFGDISDKEVICLNY